MRIRRHISPLYLSFPLILIAALALAPANLAMIKAHALTVTAMVAAYLMEVLIAAQAFIC